MHTLYISLWFLHWASSLTSVPLLLRAPLLLSVFMLGEVQVYHSPDNKQPSLGWDYFTGLLYFYIGMEPSLHNNSNEASIFQQLKGKKEMTVLRTRGSVTVILLCYTEQEDCKEVGAQCQGIVTLYVFQPKLISESFHRCSPHL